MAKADDHYTRVAEKLIEKLKEGAAPCRSLLMPVDTVRPP